MAHEIVASITIPLSDNPKEFGKPLGEFTVAWDQFVANYPDAIEKLDFHAKRATRTRKTDANGNPVRRPRKPKGTNNGQNASASATEAL